MRCTLAALIVATFSLAGKVKTQKPSSDQIFWLVLAGAFSALGFGLVYTAEKSISGGICSILNATSPLLMALVATLTGAERVSRGSLIGSFLALVGILLIFQERVHASADQAVGICLMMGSVLLAVINNVILKKHTKQQHPLASTGAFAVVCAIVFWILTGAVEARPLPMPLPVVPALAVGYLGVFGSVVAFSAYFYLIKRVRLMTLTTLVFFPPIIALVVDALWEKAVVLGPESYLGIAVTLMGVAVCVFSPKAT
jgi:drug/metabolite transporter (DMT)-like permease